MNKIIVNYASREKRFALMQDNQVEKLIYGRPDQQSLVGNIYYGTVTKVLQGMNAVFIEIGEEKNAYMPRDFLASFVQSTEGKSEKAQKSLSAFVHQGEKLLVQIKKDATGGKGAKVTGIIEIQGKYMIYMPQGRYVAVSKKIADDSEKTRLRSMGRRIKEVAEGLIFRTSSIGCSEDELRSELALLRSQYKDLQAQALVAKHPELLQENDSFDRLLLGYAEKMTEGEILVDDLSLKKQLEDAGELKNKAIRISLHLNKENIFVAHGVEKEVDKALKRIVWLENGSYLVFDQVEALTVIDVNTGKFSGRTNLNQTIVETNKLAAKEVIRQLRLRDIGGIVLIDLIDMATDEDREEILESIEAEIAKDEKRIKVLGFTSLGILQLTRKKTKVSLSEALQEKCTVCDGTGRVMSATTEAFKLERELLEYRHSEHAAVLVETTLEVKEVFEGPQKDFLAKFEELSHLKLFFNTVSNTAPFYHIRQFGTIEELSEKHNRC